MITVGLLGLNVYGAAHLERHSELSWYIPQKSYVGQFLKKLKTQYPEDGVRGSVYFGSINYANSLMSMSEMFDELQNDPQTQIASIQQWPKDFMQFVNRTGGHQPAAGT
jgi:hypothetical protein